MVKIAAIRNLGPGPMLARRKTRIRAGGSCICAPSRWKSLPLRASKPRVFTPASGGDPVFGLPLTLRPEYSGVYVRTYILFEHPNAADKFKQTKKGNRPALTSLNETRFLSYKPGGCGWAHAGSRDTKKGATRMHGAQVAHGRAKIKGMTTYLQSVYAPQSSNWPVGLMPRG